MITEAQKQKIIAAIGTIPVMPSMLPPWASVRLYTVQSRTDRQTKP